MLPSVYQPFALTNKLLLCISQKYLNKTQYIYNKSNLTCSTARKKTPKILLSNWQYYLVALFLCSSLCDMWFHKIGFRGPWRRKLQILPVRSCVCSIVCAFFCHHFNKKFKENPIQIENHYRVVALMVAVVANRRRFSIRKCVAKRFALQKDLPQCCWAEWRRKPILARDGGETWDARNRGGHGGCGCSVWQSPLSTCVKIETNPADGEQQQQQSSLRIVVDLDCTPYPHHQ